MLFEESLIYFPSKYPDGNWDAASYVAGDNEISMMIDDCWFNASDGTKLHGWFCRPTHYRNTEHTPIPDLPVVLWCHGNAGNIAGRYDKILLFAQMPVNILVFDYRGYGKSDGNPSEVGMYSDTLAAWDYLIREKRISADKIVIYGVSLGGVFAIDLATKVEAPGLIVESTFTSVRDMAAATMPYIPRFLIKTKMDSLGKISGIRAPKYFIHSEFDEVVPYRLGRKLFDAAAEPKEFYDIPRAGHNDTYLVGGREYLDRIKRFVYECTGTPEL